MVQMGKTKQQHASFLVCIKYTLINFYSDDCILSVSFSLSPGTIWGVEQVSESCNMKPEDLQEHIVSILWTVSTCSTTSKRRERSFSDMISFIYINYAKVLYFYSFPLWFYCGSAGSTVASTVPRFSVAWTKV